MEESSKLLQRPSLHGSSPGIKNRFGRQAISLHHFQEGCDEKHGVCVKPNVCHCRAGYYGYGCGNCIPLPGCMHGGCEDAYECNCFDGWKGIFCSKGGKGFFKEEYKSNSNSRASV